MNIFYLIFIYPLILFMEFLLNVSFQLTGSYGVSIIILSLIVNTVLLPLYNLAEKWQKSERKIQNLMSPELLKAKQEYKGEERYNKTVEIHKKYKYHPVYSMRTSLGFMIQVPFFIAAYTFLSKLYALNGINFLFIQDLGAVDGILVLGNLKVNILPVIMTVFNLISSFIYTKGFSKSEKNKLVIMSVVFLVLLYKSPAGLVLYWTMNNIYSLFKNLITHKLALKNTNPNT